jgi:putative Mg2+ transporter-C (MgtC) family protein
VDELRFLLNIGTALVLGVAIGLERQFRQHPAGMRTNSLVCLGAALFISLTGLMGDTNSPTRIASYIVSGIGFLGGGVILREGMNVRGMSTAATLWCSGAIGALAGAGFRTQAMIGTAIILGVHLGLRPLARWIDARRQTAIDVETAYRLQVECEEKDEGLVRNILLRHVNSHPHMTVQGISTRDTDRPGQAVVVAEIYSTDRQDRAVQEVMTRLNIEPGVRSVRWERQ